MKTGDSTAADENSVDATRSLSMQQEIDQIRAALTAGRTEQAELSVRRLLVSHRDDRQVQSLVGEVLRQRKKFDEAASWAFEMSDAETTAAVSLGWLEKAFFWSSEAGDWKAAEQAARLAVDRFPNQAKGHRYLARLLSSQGRRQDASRSVRKLLSMGVADAREVLSLIDVSGPFQLVAFDPLINPFDRGIFALGKAREKYIGENDRDQAFDLLHTLRAETVGDPSVEAFYGRLLAESNRNEEFLQWLQSVPDGIESRSEYWLAVGTWLQSNDRDLESVAALARAIEINPTDRKALRLVAAALTRSGQVERAAGVQTALSKLDSVFRKAAFADATDAFQIGATLESMVRPWEAIGWYRIAIQRGDRGPAETQKLIDRAEAIRKWESQATEEQIVRARTRKLLGFDPTEYPLPERLVDFAAKPLSGETPGETPGETSGETPERDPIVFRDVARAAGIRTTFVSDYNLNEVDFFLHQANGGGLAIIDYDLDGRGDVYVVQSGGDPNTALNSAPNELYRQTGSISFSRVETNAGCDGRGYGQGVCAADVNQDGFVDLLIANIGRNQLLINQGDGTFRDVTETHLPPTGQWTSSIGVGDLDGDQVPDMVEVNYVDDPQVFQKKCQGKVIACVPQDFRSAKDRFLKGTSDGRFVAGDSIAGDSVPRNYGFGVVIADFDGQPGNEVFVSNDGDLNHFWRRNPTSDETYLVESAGISGNAIGAAGIAEACMGVASGDFDRDGRLDLAVTNFYNEPLNLFLQSRSGAFVDDAMRHGLDTPSRSVLGFGCQAADLDNDGWLDLGVLNGHLYDYRHDGIPFQMQSQLFRGSKGGFDLQDVTAESSYFAVKRLGRTLATGDLDRDGRVDLLANHLDAPVSLLMNESEAANWLQVQLVGRVSERDAVGSIVQVHCDDETYTGWLTGGDGYMCTNEPVLHFGIGEHQRIDGVTVRWPGGESETWDAMPINQRVLLVEGHEGL